MIKYVEGNLLDADVEALVNTVNTVGVMGKGVALMFKKRYPLNMVEYSKACEEKRVRTGKMFVTESLDLVGAKWIVNFPTKRNWRGPSRLSWIIEGLEDLKSFIVDNGIKSIALPPLGCGNGGLPWNVVRDIIEVSLSGLNAKILIYSP